MLKRVIDEWGINMERAIIISDTAANNDTTLEVLFKVLDLLIYVDEVKAHRVCCFGHIFTFIAKASLSGFGVDAFDDEVKVGDAEADF